MCCVTAEIKQSRSIAVTGEALQMRCDNVSPSRCAAARIETLLYATNSRTTNDFIMCLDIMKSQDCEKKTLSPVPSPLLSFILNLTTATHRNIIFHSLRLPTDLREPRQIGLQSPSLSPITHGSSSSSLHHLHLLLFVQSFIPNLRHGSLANLFLHRPFPLLPD